MNKKHIKQIKQIVENFESDGKSDYQRMSAEVAKATGIALDNRSVWDLVNRAKAKVEYVKFDVSLLDD